MKEEKSVYLHTIGPDKYPEIKGGARTLFCRFLALTKSGTQECTYTNEQAAKEFGMSPRSAERHIKTLKDMSMLNVEKSTNAFGSNVRVITLNRDKLTHLPEFLTMTPEDVRGCADRIRTKLRNAANGTTLDDYATPSQVAAKDAAKLPNLGYEVAAKVAAKDAAKMPPNGGKVPAKVPAKLAATYEPVHLIYIGAEQRFPYHINIKNKGILDIRSATARSRAPSLFSSLTFFDLQDLRAYLPGDFTPFGQPHDLTFNFSDVYNLYGADNIENLRTKQGEFWSCANPDLEAYWRDLFVMYVLVELTCYTNDNFTRVDQCDPYGNDFEDYYFRQQYGLQHLIINAVYAAPNENEYDGYQVYKAIRLKYIAGKGNILSFARAFIVREVLNIVNDPKGCERAYRAWRRAFVMRMLHSWVDIHRYFDPDIARFMLCAEDGFAPRLFLPTLLFRRIVAIHRAALVSEYGCSHETTPRAIQFIEALDANEQAIELWHEFTDVFGESFPFLLEPGVRNHV